MEDRYVDVGGIRARYWAAGEGGEPVLLLHGIGASVEVWRATFPPLARTRRTLAVDMVGFGRSDKPRAAYSFSYLAAFVRDFLDAMKIERVTLVAHSLGGGTALRFALDFPGRLQRLVLVAPASLGRGASSALKVMTLPWVGERLSRPSRAGTARFLRLAFTDPRAVDDALVDEVYELARLPGAQEAFLASLRAAGTVMGQRQELVGAVRQGLRQISVPTLVVWGRKDRILPVAHAEVARAIPRAQVEIWDDAGHMLMAERAEKFNELLLGFLGAAEPTPSLAS